MTTDISIIHKDLDSLICLPDAEAAEILNKRIRAWDTIDYLFQRSYVERGIIVHEFRKRELWAHLGHKNFSEWMSSGFVGCRSVNYEAERDVTSLSDIPASKILDVPKSNIKELVGLSSQVRQADDVLSAAKNMKNGEFLEYIEQEYPGQHKEGKKCLRFSPERSQAQVIEEAIKYAIDNDIAANKDEALFRLAETAMEAWDTMKEYEEAVS